METFSVLFKHRRHLLCERKWTELTEVGKVGTPMGKGTWVVDIPTNKSKLKKIQSTDILIVLATLLQ